MPEPAPVLSGVGSKPALPDVPTTVEAGYPNSDFDFWIGMFVPVKTPHDIVAKLYRETAAVLQDPALQERLAKLGVEPMIMTPESFDKRVAEEVAISATLAAAAGIAVK